MQSGFARAIPNWAGDQGCLPGESLPMPFPPIDLIPDFIPILGLLDDAVLIPLGIWLFRKWVPAQIYARNLATAEAAATRPVSRAGAVFVIAIWIGLLLGLGYLTHARNWL